MRRVGAPSSSYPGAPDQAFQLSSRRVEPPVPPARERPLAPQRYGVQCTWDQETHEVYQEVRALLSHQVPSGEMALVLKAVLKLAKAQLEKRKFAATDRPCRNPRSTASDD